MNISIAIDDITSELLDYFINQDLKNDDKLFMLEADKYMKVKNTSISNRRKMMMLVDEKENPYVKDDFSKANYKAKHGYLPELVNQCTNFVAGKPIKLDYKKDISEEHKEEIDKQLYIENNFLGFLQKNIDNLQKYGKSFMRIVKSEDKIKFVTYDPKELIMFYDEFDEPILAIRYFSKVELDQDKKGTKERKYAEIFDATHKITFKQNDKGVWEKGEKELVYANKVTFSDEEGNEIKSEMTSLDVPVFPIIEWRFNDECIPTLTNIKEFIDLQDTNLSDLANNVEDVQEAIWILENYNGQNLKEFMEDLKIKKALKVGQGGNAHPETVDIPIEARAKLYELCDKNIYKFGFGINFSERDSLGNVTGVGLKWSYAPLEQKANAIENNGQEPLNNFFNILFALMGMDYDSNDLEFIFNRTMIANEQEQTQTVMSASKVLSRKTILSNLPMVKDVDDEIEELDGEDDYDEPVPKGTDNAGEKDKEETEDGNEDVSNIPDDRDEE